MTDHPAGPNRGIPCASCDAAGLDTEATTTSALPDWSGYDLCAECAAEYDARPRDRRFIDWDEPGAVRITRAERPGPRHHREEPPAMTKHPGGP